MGYYTDYSFEAPDSFMERYQGTAPELEAHLEVLREHGYDIVAPPQNLTDLVTLDEETLTLDGYTFYPAGGSKFKMGTIGKFYQYEEVFKELSKKFSGLWIVDGEGQLSGDIWKHYFKDGRDYKIMAKLTFEPFDESKLK